MMMMITMIIKKVSYKKIRGETSCWPLLLLLYYI